MKKLSLILGSLLLATTASAKEVVAAPVVVEEVIAEEAAVVEAATWKPTGSFYWEAEYRGNQEKSKGNKNDLWYNDVVGEVSLTEKDTLWFEWEGYHNIHGDSGDVKDQQDTEIAWYHDFGNLGNSKINMTSEINIQLNKETDDTTYYSGRMYFDFVQYVSGNENFNITKLALRPRIQYNEYEDSGDGLGNGGDYAVGSGIDFLLLAETQTENFGLFEYELSIYNTYFDGNTKTRKNYDADGGAMSDADLKDGGSYDYNSNGMATQIEAYLYHTIDLWKSETGKYTIDFKHEGGLDPMSFSEDQDETTVYYEPRFRLHQKLNDAIELTYSVGGYYINNISGDADYTADYQWEPRAGVAIKTVF